MEHYYKGIYGDPVKNAVFVSPSGKVIRVLKWNEAQTDEGVTMYATSGASDIIGTDSETCEFFIGITPEKDSIAQALAEIAIDGNGTILIPREGDSITLAYPLWKGTKIRTFLFTNGDEIIPPVTIKGKIIKFIQLVPIYNSEMEYKKKFNAEMLWNRFELMKVPYWSSERSESF